MTRKCDNTSVGVIVRDKRARFPVGIAPAAGHIDDHGSPELAAFGEVYEELGITLGELKKTTIYGRRVNNPCRRRGGDYHTWYVYEATVTDTTLKPDADETKGAAWYTPAELEALAARTRAFHAGQISEDDWRANPGLEEVWLQSMEAVGYVRAKTVG